MCWNSAQGRGDLGDFGVNVDINQGDYQGRSLPFISFKFHVVIHHASCFIPGLELRMRVNLQSLYGVGGILRRRLQSPVSLHASMRAYLSASSSAPTHGNAVCDIDVLSIALIGKPNVGKSTLFNRLTKSKQAIVSSIPGTTRDRRQGKGVLAGLPLNVIDTGGLDDRGQISGEIQDQVKMALQHANVIAFMVDCREGITAVDQHFAKWIRANVGKLSETQTGLALDRNPKIVVLANKAEAGYMAPSIVATISEATRFGFGNPIAISASHGDGLSDLTTALVQIARDKGFKDNIDDARPSKITGEAVDESLSQETDDPASASTQTSLRTKIPVNERTIQMAIMGKPNVGKSTFINGLLQENRVIAGPTPGLTRCDAVCCLRRLDSHHVTFCAETRFTSIGCSKTGSSYS
jgi:predicted GTPase